MTLSIVQVSLASISLPEPEERNVFLVAHSEAWTKGKKNKRAVAELFSPFRFTVGWPKLSQAEAVVANLKEMAFVCCLARQRAHSEFI